jgi:predicted nucleic acid-binding protein
MVPAVVLAETVRGSGPRDAAVNRVLRDVEEILTVDERCGRIAGGLLGLHRSDATIDALIVAATIALGGGLILTADEKDMNMLAAGHDEVSVHGI